MHEFGVANLNLIRGAKSEAYKQSDTQAMSNKEAEWNSQDNKSSNLFLRCSSSRYCFANIFPRRALNSIEDLLPNFAEFVREIMRNNKIIKVIPWEVDLKLI